jgi:hypothetical protein
MYEIKALDDANGRIIHFNVQEYSRGLWPCCGGLGVSSPLVVTDDPQLVTCKSCQRCYHYKFLSRC